MGRVSWEKAGWAVLVFAVLTRMVLAHFIPLADDGGNASYVNTARDIFSGHYAGYSTLHRLPMTSWIFAGGLRLFGGDVHMLPLLQRALGLATIAMAMGTAGLAWGRRAAVLAGLLLVMQGQFAFQESFLLSEPSARFFLALAVLCAVGLGKSRPGAGALFAGFGLGLVSGLAALTRGELIVLGPIIAAYLALAGKPGFPRGLPILCLAGWALVIGAWVIRNERVFGYRGLTPDSVTTMTTTALPLIDYDSGVELEAKRFLREQVAAAGSTNGLDPRPTTIERLQKERGYTYLRAETALGRIVREAVFARPLGYLWRAFPNILKYLWPMRWAEDRNGGRMRLPPEADNPALWSLLKLDQLWGFVVLAAALAAPGRIRRRVAGRLEAGFVCAIFVALWVVIGLVDVPVPRIQAQLFLPLALLGGFASADG
ncbi:MAG: glycosyltransferase family 39 protein [Elusimicrobia bacterium]|nr:glycosyltransferase family 39 protein [Elusimicrobiota bacterium]